jgi:hypothetical protein
MLESLVVLAVVEMGISQIIQVVQEQLLQFKVTTVEHQLLTMKVVEVEAVAQGLLEEEELEVRLPLEMEVSG